METSNQYWSPNRNQHMTNTQWFLHHDPAVGHVPTGFKVSIMGCPATASIINH